MPGAKSIFISVGDTFGVYDTLTTDACCKKPCSNVSIVDTNYVDDSDVNIPACIRNWNVGVGERVGVNGVLRRSDKTTDTQPHTGIRRDLVSKGCDHFMP